MIYEEKQIGKLIEKMKALENVYLGLIFETIEEVTCLRYDTKEHLRQPPREVKWHKIQKDDLWGGPFESMWLQGEVTISKEFEGRKIILQSNINAHECFAFLNGTPIGLFNKDGGIHDGNHSVVLLRQSATADEVLNINLECYAGTPCIGWKPYEYYGVYKEPDSHLTRHYQGLKVCAIREDVVKFVFDLKIMNQLLEVNDKNSFHYGQLVEVMMHVYKEIHLYPIEAEEEVWRQRMNKASKIMKKILEVKNSSMAGKVSLIGHAHLDTAWLWTEEEAKRKCGRTISNALTLMDWYPSYKFMQSSSLHSAWIKEYYPSIFGKMKKRVAEGRYEINGAVWVECDGNITGGESLIRQFLWGQQFNVKEFNQKSDVFWLPDTFGYSAAIPQIMKGCQVKYFLTTKMNWNESNKFPYDTFKWQGQDGSEVLVHLNQMDSWPDVKSINNHYASLSDKHVSKDKLLAYGFGDGGGGPQYQMLEMSKRVEDVYGCPRTEHVTVSDFMKNIEIKEKELPIWVGELYLELHRGTLTSNHAIKRSNRLGEVALREYEAISILSAVSGGEQGDEKKLEAWWRSLLKNQFHDILPGTCISEVYTSVIPENYGVSQEAGEAAKLLVASLGNHQKVITFINTLSWRRTAQVAVDMEGYLEGVMHQEVTDIHGEKRKIFKVAMPALGGRSYKKVEEEVVHKSAFSHEGNNLETPFSKIIFAEDGTIQSFVDKRNGRELCQVDQTNLNTFYLGEDVPRSWDNWDIDPDIDLKIHKEMELVSRKVVADGPLQFRIENHYKIGCDSMIHQQMIFYSDTIQVDFETIIEWKEKHSLLKVGFDVDILASTIKNEMQFGYVERPTHANTSWDAAKTEFCNHKWSDLSETRYGVALLNDCKYGISCKGSNMMLSLLKSGTHPDPRGDEGTHELVYSFLPHAGIFSTKTVIRQAYELNMPPTVVEGGSEIPSLVEISASNIIIESIKPAEYVQGYVLRVYESEKSKTNQVEITFNQIPKEVYETNMLEEEAHLCEREKHTVKLNFKAFEIKTIVVEY